MSKLRFNISMSLDGYVAGPNQGTDDPLGENGLLLHDWFTRTRTFKEMLGEPGGETRLDDERADASRQDFGATIMGHITFGPIRDEWAGRGGRDGGSATRRFPAPSSC
jgi:hypothetical protein